MKFLKLFFSALATFLFCFSLKALADDAVIVAPTVDELGALMASLGGLKGASAVAIALAVTQGLMLFLRTKMGEMAGKYRLLALYVLTVVSVVVAGKLSGLEWGAALVHSQALTALQVLVHQVFIQFFQKAE